MYQSNMSECRTPEGAMMRFSKDCQLELVIQKRHHEGNEFQINNDGPCCNKTIYYGDRFIPRRYSLVQNLYNQKLIAEKPISDVLSCQTLTESYWRERSFTLAMNATFGIKRSRVLSFSDSNRKRYETLLEDTFNPYHPKEFFYGKLNDNDWPCKPRSRPNMTSEHTNELIGLTSMIDWSIHNQIICNFGHDLLWWDRKNNTHNILPEKYTTALAFDPTGKYLAVGCLRPVGLQLWDIKTNVCKVVRRGKYLEKLAIIMCIEWSKTGDHLVVGNCNGYILVHSVPSLVIQNKLRPFSGHVTLVKYSPTMRYMACGDARGNVVLYNSISFSKYLNIQSQRGLCISFDWHPWNGVDLAIAEDSPGSIVILNASSKKIVAYYQRNDNLISIDEISFSRITGELLVSISRKGSHDVIESVVLVMSSLNRIVDIIARPSGATFLTWSPDGTDLITAGDDETITIWNFCSKGKKHNRRQTVNNTNKNNSPLKLKETGTFGDVFKRCTQLR